MKVWELKEYLDQCDSYEDVYVITHNKNNITHCYDVDEVDTNCGHGGHGVELFVMLECEIF